MNNMHKNTIKFFSFSDIDSSSSFDFQKSFKNASKFSLLGPDTQIIHEEVENVIKRIVAKQKNNKINSETNKRTFKEK